MHELPPFHLAFPVTPLVDARAVAAHDVDGDDVPMRHFDVLFEMETWQALAERLPAAGMRFVVEPHIRFKGQADKQATMFLRNPSGNALEFKAFADRPRLFAK